MKTCKVCLKISLVSVCLLWGIEGGSLHGANPFFQVDKCGYTLLYQSFSTLHVKGPFFFPTVSNTNEIYLEEVETFLSFNSGSGRCRKIHLEIELYGLITVKCYESSTIQPSVISTTDTLTSRQTLKESAFTNYPSQLKNDLQLVRFCLQPKGQFPINNSCNKYVNCWNGVAIEQSCSAGFYFNPVKLYCDYPANVACKGEENHMLEPFNDELSRGSLRKYCLKSTGLFPGSSCGKFVNCWDDNAVEQDCPTGLHFSPEGFCDYPEKVSCQDLNDVNGIKFLSAKHLSAKNQECPLEFGMFRDRTNCSQYYTCSFYNVVATYACAEGFSFSDVLGLCDYSYRVNCTKEPQIYQRQNFRGDEIVSNNVFASELAHSTSIGDPRCVVLFGYSRDVNDCSMYHVCKKGMVVATYRCPQGFRFSNTENKCDHIGNVQCDSSFIFFKGDRSVILPNLFEEILQVRYCVPGTIFRLNPQCSSACRCQTGFAEIIRCSEGLAYDSQKDKCVPINVARC